MRTIPTGPARRADVSHQVLTIASREFSVAGSCIATAPGSNAWQAANKPLALPFRLSRSTLLTQLGWMNGGSAGGNVDVGVYDRSWNRKVSTGSTAGSGSSAWQFVDVTDTLLLGGHVYYLVMVRDNTTANRNRAIQMGATAPSVQLTGAFDSGTDAFPLPDPLTNMVPAATFITVPVLAMAFRAPF